MTRQERADFIVRQARWNGECETHEPFYCECSLPDDIAMVADHLAALEQQAITAYLAEVPLPEGWREERDGLGGREWPVVRYLEAVQGLDTPVERAFANKATIHVNTMPAHWPAIPQAVLIRAAVQCHRFREEGRA